MFELLASRIGEPISEQQLSDRVFDDDDDVGEGAVFLYISYLRTKLNSIGANMTIENDDSGAYTLTLS
jgi:DNA-binding response OmpR family regulator